VAVVATKSGTKQSAALSQKRAPAIRLKELRGRTKRIKVGIRGESGEKRNDSQSQNRVRWKGRGEGEGERLEEEGVVFRRLSEGGVRERAKQKEREERGKQMEWRGRGQGQGREDNGSVQGQNQFLRRGPIVQNSLREDGGEGLNDSPAVTGGLGGGGW